MKKFPAFLLRSCLLLCTLWGNAQVAVTNFDDTIIPEKYQLQFDEDNRKLSDYTDSLTSVANRTHSLLLAVERGDIKNYSKDSLAAVLKEQGNEIYIKQIAFIKQYPSSYASLFNFKRSILTSHRFSPDSLLQIFTLIDKDLRETPLGVSVRERIKLKESININKEVPVFSFRTQKGQRSNLGSFRQQKYILLCFWASWCGPCVKNIPLLKKIDSIYYNKGLQLISASIDKKQSDWLTALQKHNMPWLQTCNLPDYIQDADLMKLYPIDYIPQYFLIDKAGKLIYHSALSNDDDEHSKLQDLLSDIFE